MIYERIIRPIFFLIPPERIHLIVARLGEIAGRTPIISWALGKFFRVKSRKLRTHVLGMDLENPIGLSAGFDKDAKYFHFTNVFGFGFSEVGSVTAKPYEGNPGPHLRRLVKNKSLVVNYGLKSEGVEKIVERLRHSYAPRPYGISIAKTNSPDCVGKNGVEDYLVSYKKLYPFGSYTVLNLSCPNTSDGTPFSEPAALEGLLSAVANFRSKQHIQKPLAIKIAADIPKATVDEIILVAERFHVDGIVISNLSKTPERAAAELPYPEEYDTSWSGGVSGTAVQKISTDMISYVYGKTQGSIDIIGVGGIYSGRDAYQKILAGASALELITGFIYGGPATIRNINKELIKLLKADGYANISEARGKISKHA